MPEESPKPVCPEVRTRRLVVVDERGEERIVAEVSDGTAELRVRLPRTARGRSCDISLYAREAGRDIDAAVGLQIWANGDPVLELNAWPADDGTWTTDVQLGPAE